MFKRLLQSLSTAESFVQLFNGLKRRLREAHFILFRKIVIKGINRSAGKQLANNELVTRISLLLNLPEVITVSQGEKDYIIQTSDKILCNVFNLLGSGDTKLDPINWHADFKSGFIWPSGKFFRKYKQEDRNNHADVKVPRELSRSHHLLTLAVAYRLTGEKKYAKVCIDQLNNWIAENPLMYSINWGCTMDVAIRAVNWIWALGLLSGSELLDEKFLAKIKTSLYQHGWYIWRYPEWAPFNNGNHYLADLAGQIHLGLLFGSKGESQEWLKKGVEELFREIRMEILPSGMSYERSTNYNRMVLELILIPIILLRRNNHEIPLDIWYRLEKMFAFIMNSVKPDGNTPIIGDQDNGRVLPLNDEKTINFKYLLSIGALLFKRSDFKFHSEGYNIFCSLFGDSRSYEKWNEIPCVRSSLESVAYPDIGLYIMRQQDNYLIFNSTGRGLYPELNPGGAHTHSDLFSFELFTLGKTFLLDPGSYVYTADADMRMLFRSTKMHNTVTVDGESQNILSRDEFWNYERNAIPEVIKWESNKDYDIIAAKHNGYERLPEPVTHERTIIYDKNNIRWEIKDLLSGEGRHSCEWHFHFDDGIDFEILGNSVSTICDDGRNLQLNFESKQKILLRKEKSFISKSYGVKQEGLVLIGLIDSELPLRLEIEISRITNI